jgi:UDP-2,3-diacylglucosamine pyrophosphatase LpxH
MLDAVILSDLHLGSDNCQARDLCTLFERIAEGELRTSRLILNGDVFNSIDFRRLTKNHWKVLSWVRKLSDQMEIVWICGNHDGSAEIISHLLGVSVVDEYELTSGGRRVLLLHGHLWDDFLVDHPVLSWFADRIYGFLQWIDRTHYLAKVAKKGSKTFLRCARKIEQNAMAHAARKGCHVVCCGHTHHATVNTEGPVHYYNSGCWTERPCTYLTVEDGVVDLCTFQPDEAPVEKVKVHEEVVSAAAV